MVAHPDLLGPAYLEWDKTQRHYKGYSIGREELQIF